MLGVKPTLFQGCWSAWLAAGLLAAAACGPAPRKVNFVVLDQDIPIDQLHVAPTNTPPAEPVTASLAEARAAAPFTINTPAWAPGGFQLLDSVEVATGPSGAYDSVELAWQNPDGLSINLTLAPTAAGEGRLAGAGTVETVSVNGQPASLRHSTGLSAGRLVLSWTRAGLAYRLAAPADAVVDSASLVRMAESIP